MSSLFPARVVLRLDIDNPERIHPELLRDDVADALCERGFGGFALEVIGECVCGHAMDEHDQFGCVHPDGCTVKGATVDV